MSKRTWKVCAQDNGECKGRTSVISAVRCHQCGGSLIYEIDGEPVTLDNINPDGIDLDNENDNERKTFKQRIGGFFMNMKTNWKKIAYASLALILIIGIVLFSKAILATLGIIAGTIGLIGLGLLVLTFVCLFASEIKPESRFSRGWKPSLQIGLCLVIAAIILWVLLPWLDAQKTVNQNQTPATSETSKPQSHSLGLPADLKDVDQNVWDKPLEAGVMVDGNGNAVYTQTGKDGSFLLKGKIYEGQVLVLDSNKLSKTIEGKVESYSNGNLLIIVGPYDLDADPISYTDGGAQPVGRTELQSFLDNNIAVKFARGNWDEKKNQWSYQPWALTHFWLPDGIKYNKLTLTHETDTYPGRDNAPTMTNTK